MPSRLGSQIYQPEVIRLMKDAFDTAWPMVKAAGEDAELTRYLLASAIIDQVNAGVDDSETIAARAVATLAVARNVSHTGE
jgi:hypothetical protein